MTLNKHSLCHPLGFENPKAPLKKQVDLLKKAGLHRTQNAESGQK